jgi:5-methylcytosine-specific restriction endonuclease McrA
MTIGWKHLAALRRVLLRSQLGLCGICGEPLYKRGIGAEKPTTDHVFCLSRGGPNRLGNMVAAHSRCNHKKADRRPTGCEIVMLMAVNNRLQIRPAVLV